MKDKITEEQMMAFLYGEISPEERREVEDFLRNNPEKQMEMEALGDLRRTLAGWQDREGIEEPNIFASDEIRNDRQPFHLWKKLAIAASIALLISVGYINYRGFSQQDVEEKPVITDEQLVKILAHQESIAGQNKILLERIADLEKQVSHLSDEQEDQKNRLATYDNPDIDLAKSLVSDYMVALQEQNKLWLDENFRAMNEQQQAYVNNLLTDFGTYITEQQRQDVEILQARLQYLEQNTGEIQYATAKLIANLNNTQLQQENY